MDCGIMTSKLILLLLSLVFWAAGAALTYVGVSVIKSYNNYEHFFEDQYTFIPAAIIVAIAVLMFIVGFVGCFATLTESCFGLGFFLLVLLVFFAGEITALVFGFIYRGKIKDDLEHTMTGVFQKYDGQNSETRAVDYLQTQLHCCGAKNYTDWRNTTWFSTNHTVPLSCCATHNSGCTGRLDQPTLLNTLGCEFKLVQLLQDAISYVMLVVVGFANFKLFGVVSVCVITCRDRQRHYLPL
ncbi:tetraspanin 36 [Paramormyrops kingsleyae]|uniref:Tetraspanin n=1 Tax=Paramormyrops kingsleyae TaxID=1676925 RepID=A0A3B3T980_9TELE|nr:tetraspanin-36-like [Paramormyrops kingsleyae]